LFLELYTYLGVDREEDKKKWGEGVYIPRNPLFIFIHAFDRLSGDFQTTARSCLGSVVVLDPHMSSSRIPFGEK
jgi:hypothetical protein